MPAKRRLLAVGASLVAVPCTRAETCGNMVDKSNALVPILDLWTGYVFVDYAGGLVVLSNV